MAEIFILQITILSNMSGDMRHNLGLWTIILICNGTKYFFVPALHESIFLGHSKQYNYIV